MIKIEVTQADIDKAISEIRVNHIRPISQHCPIAKALSRTFGTPCWWAFGRGGTLWDLANEEYQVFAKHDDKVFHFQEDFDFDREVKPITFYVKRIR